MPNFDDLLTLTLAADSAAESGNLQEVNAVLTRRGEVLDALEAAGFSPSVEQVRLIQNAEQSLRLKLERQRGSLVADSGDMQRARKAAIAYRASQ